MHFKINSTLIDSTEDFGKVMLMYTLLEYSQNCSMASGSLRNYYGNKIDDVDNNAWDSKSVEYKTKLVANTPERPRNEEDANRPPKLSLHIESLLHSNMSVIFGDILISYQ